MPGLARKVLICAAIDGLVLQPLAIKREQRNPQPVKIRYGDAVISYIGRDNLPDLAKPNASFEAFGIVGLITISRFSYLVSITRRRQVAQIRGFPVYVITEVALTPCSTYNDASEAVARTSIQLQKKAGMHSDSLDEGSDSGDEDIDISPRSSDDVDGSDDNGKAEQAAAQRKSKGKTTVAQDVMTRRGSYGRFAQRWFSRSGWMQEQKRTMGLSNSEESVVRDEDSNPGEAKSMVASEAAGVPVKDAAVEEIAPPALLSKLLRTTHILFGSRSYFFSYDYDITRNLSRQNNKNSGDVPLYQRVDRTYFWNHHIIQPFIDAGLDSLALPLMKGFVGQRTFTVDSQPPQVDEYNNSLELSDFGTKWSSSSASDAATPPNERVPLELRPSEKRFDLTVISRRSIQRAGLRYLRRGIDEDGNTANTVETEQILTPKILEEGSTAYSYLQLRGSIPVFFTQTPYSLKPTPVFQHTNESNFQALKKHFDRLHKEYGALQVANLLEKHGIEAPIGERYQQGVERYNEECAREQDKIPFEWFDFHAVCRGMKFENVQKLIEKLKKQLDSFGSTVEENGEIKTQQRGIIRTNCMDCLDRTNVCQSSFAKYMLDLQLKEQGFDMTVQRDQVNSWFNGLWADNGDAISRQYASTAAMKGDYTRTRTRNYRGALADAGIGLTRFFNGMVNDFFLQATIDFLLGNVTSVIFEEFEANMMTKDPAVSVQKMRDQAIELCQKRVVADEKEEFIGGWSLLSPAASNSITATPFEEVVFLLTDTAMYLCRFDWNLDKVSSFERADLSHVRHIKFGTYITSTLSSVQTDETRNIGFVVEYKPGSTDIQRINTRSLSSLKSRMTSSAAGGGGANPTQSMITGLLGRRAAAAVPETEKIAFKAPYSTSSIAEAHRGSRLTEEQLVVTICAEVERLAFLNQPVSGHAEKNRETIVENGDIISLAEAKRNVGLFEQLGHSIKRMVWA